MDVVIFAAGLGSRLGQGIPKCLVEVRGKKILEHQLEALNTVLPDGIIHVVTGYRHELVEAFLQTVRSRLPVRAHRNPFFRCAGILGSGWIARQFVASSEVIRIDGDVLFSVECLKNLLAAPRSALLVVPCESGKHTAVAELVPGTSTLKKISLLDNYHGGHEWMCMELYRNGEYAALMEEGIDALPLDAYYFEALNRFYGRQDRGIDAVSGPEVYEIDTPADLALTEKEMAKNAPDK